MKTLVTGASGHLGANLVRALRREGRDVRALVRPASDLRGIEGHEVELASGDVLRRDDVERAVRGCSRVFHLAALYSVDERARDRIVATAVEGTRNVIEAAARERVERVVFTSSVAVLESTPDPTARDESSAAPLQGAGTSAYVRAKVESESLALELGRARGVPVVAVNPSMVLGPLDLKPTPSTRAVVTFLRRSIPFYAHGGINAVDARDVAEGHLLAEAAGVPGERYILGGTDVTIRRFLEEIARVSGLRPPRVRLGRGALLLGAALLSAGSRLAGRTPLVPLARARHFAGRYAFVSSEKARRVLGYSTRPFHETIKDTVLWCLDQDWIPRDRREHIRGFLEAPGV